MDITSLKKEITRLSSNIKRRIKRLESKFGETPTIKRIKSQYKDFTVKLDSDLTPAQQTKVLKSRLRRLKYLNELKTSTVKGQKKYNQKMGSLGRMFTEAPGTADVVWSLYNMLVEENGLWAKYKYEVLEIIEQYVSYGFGVNAYGAIKDEVENMIGELERETENLFDSDNSTRIY